jgi:SAM-dependent methyltransferase
MLPRARAQTDGWLSEQSAKVYEVSTETLFLGRQDAMQRQALVPLAGFMRGRPGRAGAGTRLLELACGTGRFATFIKARRAAGSWWQPALLYVSRRPAQRHVVPWSCLDYVGMLRCRAI